MSESDKDEARDKGEIRVVNAETWPGARKGDRAKIEVFSKGSRKILGIYRKQESVPVIKKDEILGGKRKNSND